MGEARARSKEWCVLQAGALDSSRGLGMTEKGGGGGADVWELADAQGCIQGGGVDGVLYEGGEGG